MFGDTHTINLVKLLATNDGSLQDVMRSDGMREEKIRYSIEDGEAYWGERWLKGADVSTFMFHDERWAHDAKHVWEGGAEKRSIDASTFKYLNVVYSRDAKQVHTCAGPVKGADASSFEPLDSGYQVETWRYATNLRQGGYGRDARRVYYNEDLNYKAHQLKGADAKSFASFGNGYGRDDSAIYCRGFRLPGADLSSWLYVGRGYSLDRNAVFYGSKPIDGVNPDRFAVCHLPTTGRYATDGERYFSNDDVVAPKVFYEAVASFHEDVGVIVERWWPGTAKSRGKVSTTKKTAAKKSPTIRKKSPTKKVKKGAKKVKKGAKKVTKGKRKTKASSRSKKVSKR